METIPSNAGIGAAAASLVNISETISTTKASPSRNAMTASRVSAPHSVLIYSPQFNTIGGVETHLVRLSCLLANKNWRVTLVTTSGRLEKNRVDELKAAGVEFIAPVGAKTLSVPRKAAWLTWLVATRLRHQHWDVLYTNAQGSLSWLLFPLKREGTRIIHHYHTAGDERDEETWDPPFVKWLSTVDEIVACSASTAQNLRRVIGPLPTVQSGCHKVRVIRYLSADVAPLLTRPPRDPNAKLRFGFLGRLARGKGIDMICRLSTDAELAHVEWHLHGIGTDYDATHFKNFPNVHYHGRYRGAAELSSILAQLDALVLLSTYQEGQPISLIEGMAAGLPWIATDQGGTRELMWSEANCRLISTECSFEEAKAAVLDLAQAIHEGKTSFAAQRRAYEDNLGPAIVGERWTEFLGEAGARSLERVWLGGVLTQ